MALLVPGKAVTCIKPASCPCGRWSATQGSIYICQTLAPGGPLHSLWCNEAGCELVNITVEGKGCFFCSCCFAPLDPDDTSLVKDETETYDDIVRREDRESTPVDGGFVIGVRPAPIKKPTRVLV